MPKQGLKRLFAYRGYWIGRFDRRGYYNIGNWVHEKGDGRRCLGCDDPTPYNYHEILFATLEDAKKAIDNLLDVVYERQDPEWAEKVRSRQKIKQEENEQWLRRFKSRRSTSPSPASPSPSRPQPSAAPAAESRRSRSARSAGPRSATP